MKIAGVILAAGGSTRFRAPKQLASYNGENLVRRAARVAIETGLEPVIIVLGAFAPVVEPLLAGLDNVVIVVNDDWKSGQSASLKKGISAAMKSGSEAALVMLADQPLVDAGSLSRLISAFDTGDCIVAAEYAKTIGVPAIFGSRYFDDLLELSGDRGAGQLLRDQTRSVVTVPLPEAAVDIDSPEDLSRLESGMT